MEFQSHREQDEHVYREKHTGGTEPETKENMMRPNQIRTGPQKRRQERGGQNGTGLDTAEQRVKDRRNGTQERRGAPFPQVSSGYSKLIRHL